MQAQQLLALQFVLSLAAYMLIAAWFAEPWLARQTARRALMILLVPQLFRHLGANLLAVGVAADSLPREFAIGTARGDLLTVGLAWLGLVSLRCRWRYGLAAVWLCNVVGCADLLFNLIRAARVGAAQHLAAAWYVPAFIVPCMLVSHALIFLRLWALKSLSLSDAGE